MYVGFICIKYTWFHCTHCDLHLIQALVSRRVSTNELIRTFDLHYVTRSNRRKHPYSSDCIASEYTLYDSFPIRQDFENVFCSMEANMREQTKTTTDYVIEYAAMQFKYI